jgi:peptide/nickel transport system permease protein
VIKLVAVRLLMTIPVMAAVSFIAFGLQALVPGDPAVALAGENATAERIAEVRSQLGLDDPFAVQYVHWVSDVLHGDLGSSLYSGRPVIDSISERLPVTLSLAAMALIIALVIAVPAGILAATKNGKPADTAATVVASIGLAMPSFWLGLLLVLLFSITLGWLPSTGYVPFAQSPMDWLIHLLLPALTLGAAAAAEIMRQLRSSLTDVLKQDYIRTARAKGIRARLIVPTHALRNAASPVVTVIGFLVAFLLGGSIVVEQLFVFPGLGALTIQAVLNRDLPVIQGVILVTTLVVVLVNLLVDMVNAWLNPKVRVG